MNVLVLFTADKIAAWLVGEPLESAAAHIAGGYPHLEGGWQAGSVQAAVIDVPEADTYRPDLYEVIAGDIRRKEA